MIYIKTEMKEMPTRCAACEMAHTNVGCRTKVQSCAAKVDKNADRGYSPIIFSIYHDSRPSWCPLVEVQDEVAL